MARQVAEAEAPPPGLARKVCSNVRYIFISQYIAAMGNSVALQSADAAIHSRDGRSWS